MTEPDKYLCECEDEGCGLELEKSVYERAYDVYLQYDQALMILHPDCSHINDYHFVARTRDYVLVTLKK